MKGNWCTGKPLGKTQKVPNVPTKNFRAPMPPALSLNQIKCTFCCAAAVTNTSSA